MVETRHWPGAAGHYGGYGLILASWLVFTGLIPSAAGPADAWRGQRAAGPVASVPGVAAAPETPVGADAATAPLTAPALTLQMEASAPADLPALLADAPATLPATDRIVLPGIGVDAAVIDVGVLPNGEMETAAYAAGRLATSAQAGEAGNTVIAGHNDVLGEVFRRLPELQMGDDVLLYRGETRFRYRIEARTIVREAGATEAQRRENALWMGATDDATTTLVSCYPYRVDTHRIIVRARLLD